MQVDVIVVGQGIAGSALAAKLLEHGLSIMVIDKEMPNTASKIAAGIYHPYTFRRFGLSWEAGYLHEQLDTFYAAMQAQLDNTFYHPIGIQRLCGSKAEAQFWQMHAASKLIMEEPSLPSVLAPFGMVHLEKAGYVNTSVWLKAFRHYLFNHQMLKEETFDYSQLILQAQSVIYQDLLARYLVFCQGAVADNPWFSSHWMRPAKGEVLHIAAPLAESIIHGKCYAVPQGKHFFKLGSTFRWKFKDEEPEAAGIAELKQKWEGLYLGGYELIKASAGIRPASFDRRPVLGFHPKYKCLGIFNGLGSKGVWLAPAMAHALAQFLTKGIPIDREVALNRILS